MSLMTSSSDCESRFFFLRLLPSSGVAWAAAAVAEAAAAPPGTPLLTLRLLLLLPAAEGAAGRSPLAWARSPADVAEGDDSPFCADRQASSGVWPWPPPPPPPPPPAPLACMVPPLTRLWPLLRCGAAGAAGGSPTTTTTEEEAAGEGEGGGGRPARPAEAPGSPAPSAAEARGFFRGGGEAPPASESEEEEAEARVSSPREAVVGGRRGAAGVGGAGGGGEGGPGPSPPLRRRSRRGPGARGHWGGRGPEAGAPTAAAEAAAEAAAASVLGPRRSAPWCVDSSPSCCLMESGRWRHRKCLYCPPRSLPAAGMEPIGGCHPARVCPAAWVKPWGEGEGRRVPAPGEMRPSTTWPARASRPGSWAWRASLARSKFAATLRGPAGWEVEIVSTLCTRSDPERSDGPAWRGP